MQETSTKPYMLRALHEWCTDNGYTPYIVVTVDDNTVVPAGYVQDGQITLNLDLLATNQLVIGNDYIEFQARFGGVAEDLFVPVAAVSAIYARETGAGMGFEVSESPVYPGTNSTSTSAPSASSQAPAAETGERNKADKAPHLKIVK